MGPPHRAVIVYLFFLSRFFLLPLRSSFYGCRRRRRLRAPPRHSIARVSGSSSVAAIGILICCFCVVILMLVYSHVLRKLRQVRETCEWPTKPPACAFFTAACSTPPAPIPIHMTPACVSALQRLTASAVQRLSASSLQRLSASSPQRFSASALKCLNA